MRFTFKQALDYMKRGDTARREGWTDDMTLHVGEDNALYRGTEKITLSQEDMQAKDWIVYRPERKMSAP